ncbi:MAG: dihydropteroate synthase [Myxococcota bacterium]
MPGWSQSPPTQIMGVLNVTPDSFSDGGLAVEPRVAVDRAQSMMVEGAHIVDVGGESTRPGAEPVSEADEIARVLPTIEALDGLGVRVSIDTYKAEVAARALTAGASIVNDISGGTFEPEILEVAAEKKALLVLSHARARPRTMQEGTWTYEGGVVAAVGAALHVSVQRALEAGVERSAIAVDPGIGFGKTDAENLDLLRNLDRLRPWPGCPILVGTSRKGFIGRITGRPVDQREMGTAATVALAIAGGADLVRVHDVQAAKDVVRMSDAWVHGHLGDSR